MTRELRMSPFSKFMEILKLILEAPRYCPEQYNNSI